MKRQRDVAKKAAPMKRCTAKRDALMILIPILKRRSKAAPKKFCAERKSFCKALDSDSDEEK